MNLKDLEAESMTVEYNSTTEIYELSCLTKGDKGLIHQKFFTKDGTSDKDIEILIISSKDGDLLKTLKGDLLRAIKTCECGN